jgi:hypothetical protein
MNTSLEHLPEHKQKQLKEIAGIIVKAVDPEKVILFGSHATGRWVEHRYTEGGITYEYISDYDIPVITKSGETRKDSDVKEFDKAGAGAASSAGAIIHETTEQLAKSKDGLEPGDWSKTAGLTTMSPEFIKDRPLAIKAENKVNGNKRDDQTDIFTDKHGHKHNKQSRQVRLAA